MAPIRTPPVVPYREPDRPLTQRRAACLPSRGGAVSLTGTWAHRNNHSSADPGPEHIPTYTPTYTPCVHPQRSNYGIICCAVVPGKRGNMENERLDTPQQLITDVVAVAALVVSIVGMSVALSALLFTGRLSDGLPQATGTFIVGAGAFAAWMAFRSGIVPMVSVAQDAPAVVLVAVLARIAEQSPEIGVADVVVLIAVSTAAAGVAMLALGALGLGEAVRYLPTVVVNGFIAGTGWLLIRGGFDIMVGSHLTLGNLGDLADADLVVRWAPGLALGVVVFGVGAARRIPDVATSAAIVAAAAIFYAVVVTVTSIDSVEDGGWLIGPFGESARQTVIGPNDLADANWAAFAPHSADMLSLLLVTIVALLLNLSALEVTKGARVDTSDELRSAGVGNIAISLLGSIPVFHALGDTVLAERMGVRRRIVPVIAGVIVMVFGLIGAQAVGYAPVFVAGGLLVAVGFNLLVNWFSFLRSPIGWIERSVSITVTAVIIFIGILEGVVAGLILACGVFVFRYSRVDPIRRSIDNSVMRSRVDRSVAESTVLRAAAGQAKILELQGYLFFGSVIRLVDDLRDVASDTTSDTQTVLLDFRFVTGLDPGAAQVLVTLLEELQASGVEVGVSGPSATMLDQFAKPCAERVFRTLDEALADVEQRTLVAVEEWPSADPHADRHVTAPWLDAFEPAAAQTGTTLIAEGDPGDSLIYMISGTAGVYATSSAGDRHRVRQLLGPAWLGEIGFLRNMQRSADVIADSDVTYASIDRASFERLRMEQPDMVIQILDDIALSIADRTATLTEALTQSLD